MYCQELPLSEQELKGNEGSEEKEGVNNFPKTQETEEEENEEPSGDEENMSYII